MPDGALRETLLAVPVAVLAVLLTILAVVFAFSGDGDALLFLASAAVLAAVAAALLACVRRWTGVFEG